VANFSLTNDMRVGCLGFTGSGKTKLMELMLTDQPRVIIIDNKHRVNFPGYFLTSDPTAALLEPKTILRPEAPIPNSFWEDAMEVLHEAGGGIIYIDELSEVCTSNTMPAGLRSIFRMGRELGVGIWWSAQAASEVTNTALRLSNILILFLNLGASDRDKIIRIAGDIGEITAHLDFYEFVVFESANRAYDPRHIPVYKLPAAVAA
jgi:hypothetical protein